MNPNKRPISVTILALVYIAVGTTGFIYHFADFRTGNAFHNDVILIEFTELLAVTCGAFLLRGQNWARWLALAWMAFHVVLSAFHAFGEFAIHALFCAIIVWVLLRDHSASYFNRQRVKAI